MAIYIGKEELLAKRQNILQLTDNMKKGLTGEIEVGELLSKNLPDDTYVVSHPVIGRFEPDFLVISPRYGFVLIEVKNWALDPIKSASSNGTLEILGDVQNPFAQIRAHVEDLSGYLLFNERTLKEPYRLIGFAVVHYGFTKQAFVAKFNTNTSWNPDQTAGFFKHHIFRDQLNQDINTVLKGTLKYATPAVNGLSEDLIKDIISKITLSKTMPSEAELELLHKTKELDERTNLLMKKTEELDVKVTTLDQNHPIEHPLTEKPPELSDQSQSKRKYIIAVVVIILALLIYKYSSAFTKETGPSEQTIKGNIETVQQEQTINDSIETGPQGQTIKGNINSRGEKIYHVPVGRYYDQTNPEEWFFTEEDARAAGYRKSKV